MKIVPRERTPHLRRINRPPFEGLVQVTIKEKLSGRAPAVGIFPPIPSVGAEIPTIDVSTSTGPDALAPNVERPANSGPVLLRGGTSISYKPYSGDDKAIPLF